MSFFKRSVLYISRKKGRSILLLVILFVMAFFFMTGIAIKTSADEQTGKLRSSMGSGFTLSCNISNESLYKTVVTKEGPIYRIYAGPVVTKEMLDRILNIDGVINYSVTQQILMWVNLKLRPGMYASMYQEKAVHQWNTLEGLELSTQVTSIFGCYDSSLQEYFRTGAFGLSEGRHIQPTDSNKAVISRTLAERNHLSIGDAFRAEVREGVYQPTDTPFKTWGNPIEFEVAGIFDINFEQEPSEFTSEKRYAENLIFCDMNAANQTMKIIASDANRFLEATFFTDSPQDLDSIIAKVRKLDGIQWEYYTIKWDDVAYKASVKPLKQISGISTALIVLVVIGCVVLLYLVLNMWIKSRKREMGILLSIGLTKKTIVPQLILESTIVMGLALVLAFALSGTLLNLIGTWAEGLVSPAPGQDMYSVSFDQYHGLTPIIEKISAEPVHLAYKLSSSNVVIMIAVVFGVMAISVLAASAKIMKMKPKDILSSH